MSTDNHSDQQDFKPGSNRRDFLKKASAGVVIASIPAKSVWATGSPLGASIGASGVGSEMSTSKQLCLQSAGRFAQKVDYFADRLLTFFSIFGGLPFGYSLSHSSSRFSSYNSRESSVGPKLGEVLGNNTDDKHHRSSSSFDGRKGKGGKRSNNKKELKGPSNVNFHMVAMYMNAKYHGTAGIHYPVVGPHPAPFATPEHFARHLYQMASKDPAAIGVALGDLIEKNHV